VTKGCLKGKKCDECNVKFMGGPKIVGEGAVGLYWPSRKMTAKRCTICGVIVCYPCRGAHSTKETQGYQAGWLMVICVCICFLLKPIRQDVIRVVVDVVACVVHLL
jgi:hypothetical protein